MIDYHRVSCFQERPTAAIRYLINRNLQKLVHLCIQEATQFINTSQTKLKALSQLKHTIIIAENAITKHTEIILKSLARIYTLQIEGAQAKSIAILEVLGACVSPDYYVPLIMEVLRQQDFKNSLKNTTILLNILSRLLATATQIEKQLGPLVEMIASFEKTFYDDQQGLVALLGITANLIKNATKFEKQQEVSVLFSLILNVQATASILEVYRLEAANIMKILANKSGFQNVEGLHAHQVRPLLTAIMQNKEYTKWSRTSKDRFKFDMIIRNCHSEAVHFLRQTLQILEFMVNPQSQLQIRMDALVLLEYLLGVEELRQQLVPMSEQLIKKIIVPSIQWKIGKPQIKIRKAGIINLLALINRKLTSEQQLLDCFKDLLPHLKTCLSDDWAPELRLATCELLQKYLMATKLQIGDDQLRELYVILLERLDDSQNPIRKKATVAINVFFLCRYLKLSSSIVQYMISAIFVHYDDNDEEIQDAINISLRHAAKVNPKQVLKNAKMNLQKMKHKQKCRELIEYCEEVIADLND